MKTGLQVSRFDERHRANVYVHASVEGLELTDEPRQRHRVEVEGLLPLDALVLPKRSARLTVALHGAYGPEAEPPRFQFLRSTEHRDESLVFLADPSIEMDPSLFIGWYVGTAASPVAHRFADLVKRIAELVGATEIVLYGHSGGGFAAETIGHSIPNSVSLMLNAQTRPAKFYGYRSEPFREFAFPETSNWHEAEAQHPQLLDLRALEQEPAAAGHRVLSYQAPGDELHWREHWIPWAETHGVGPEGGVSDDGSKVFRLADWGDTHAGPPLINPYIDEAYRLFNPGFDPDSTFDMRHRAPIFRHASIDELTLSTHPRQRHRIAEEGELPLDVLVLPRQSKQLTVALHGAFGKEVVPPRFQYLRSIEPRDESLIFIADPGIEADPSLGLAWYVGTAKQPTAARLAALVRKVASLLAVDETVLFGHSGGGFAAAAIGHDVPNSVALMLNGQTRIAAYYEWAYRPFLAAAFPDCANAVEAEQVHAPLIDLRARYAIPPAPNHLVLAFQTKGDTLHWEEHWGPFAESLGVSAEGGLSADGRFAFNRATWGETHAGPPKLDPYLDDAYAMLQRYLDR